MKTMSRRERSMFIGIVYMRDGSKLLDGQILKSFSVVIGDVVDNSVVDVLVGRVIGLFDGIKQIIDDRPDNNGGHVVGNRKVVHAITFLNRRERSFLILLYIEITVEGINIERV